jgi:hypothetical protein
VRSPGPAHGSPGLVKPYGPCRGRQLSQQIARSNTGSAVGLMFWAAQGTPTWPPGAGPSRRHSTACSLAGREQGGSIDPSHGPMTAPSSPPPSRPPPQAHPLKGVGLSRPGCRGRDAPPQGGDSCMCMRMYPAISASS